MLCDVPVAVAVRCRRGFLKHILILLAAVYVSMRSFAVFHGMIFLLLLGIFSGLQAINIALQQELNDLREKLNKLIYQQPASEAELQDKASENELLKANVGNCEGEPLV